MNEKPTNIPPSGFWEIVLWMLRRRKRFRLDGMSMSPVLRHREEILVDCRAYHKQNPRIGDIVIIRHPFQSDCRMIKRITAIDRKGNIFLQGENREESTDSRSFGWVEPRWLLGKVTSRWFSPMGDGEKPEFPPSFG